MAMRRFTTTGGPNVLVMNLLKSIVMVTDHATPALLDHSTLYQAVEEAMQRGNPSRPIAQAPDEILSKWGPLVPHMTLVQLQAPSFLWENQEQAAEDVWLEAA
eukprot:12836292-Heterocapsa_arctica.AAC.1